MSKRVLNVAIAFGMIVGLLAGVVGSASAATPTTAYGGQNWIFYPWVPNGETVDNTGPWYGSITIQNVEDSPIQVTFGPTGGTGALANVVQNAIINAHAAYTFSAADIFGAASKVAGGGVAATAVWDPNALPSFCSMSLSGTPLVVQRDDDVQNLPSGQTKTADQDVVAALPAGAVITGAGTGTYDQNTGQYTYQYVKGTDFTSSGNEITWISSNRPNENKTYDVWYETEYCGWHNVPFFAGVEKQAAPDSNGFGVWTSHGDMSVDGYSAISDADVAWGPNSTVCSTRGGSLGAIGGLLGGYASQCNDLGGYFLGLPIGSFFQTSGKADFGFDGTSYLPIVQSNWSGWDTIINVTNVDASTPSYSQVTVTFYNQGQGVGNQAVAVKQFSLAAGASMQIDTASLLGSKPFLGSVWITSDFAVVANAVRIKASTDMSMINTSVPSALATTSPTTTGTTETIQNGNGQLVNVNVTYVPGENGELTMYAPLIFKNYNGWNTGIDIANTSEFANQVTVQFFSYNGTSLGLTTTYIPPKGMQYVYMPATQDQGLGNGDFGSAVLTGTMPFAATVDEVKYSTGDAMTYQVTGTTVEGASLLCQVKYDEPGGNWIIIPGTSECDHGDQLALPIFQNGQNLNGVEHDDTTGINIFNPGSTVTNGVVNFYALDGSLQTPSNIGSVPFSVAPMSSALVYAPSMAQMTPIIQLTAVVSADPSKSGTGNELVAVSNTINYDVNGDGAVVYNLFNQFGQYRYVCSQSQCGLKVIINNTAGVYMPIVKLLTNP
ncbi:MAG TPA: hypothetical protein VKU87_11435 [Thermomicrobiaceae bacterium]|nr:hypothetical protein [Thermomicrobiaceae bacterium]